MTRRFALLLFLAAPALCADPNRLAELPAQPPVTIYAYPDPKLTPGVTNPALTKEVICSKSFRTGPYRKVTQKMHREVWAAYGMDWNKGHSCCEDDHLISIEIGGANDNANRWPQPWAEAHEKDKVENFLHKQVCSDKMTLEEAQREIVSDWRKVKIQ